MNKGVGKQDTFRGRPLNVVFEPRPEQGWGKEGTRQRTAHAEVLRQDQDFLFYYLFIYGYAPRTVWDLSSATRDLTHTPCSRSTQS